MGKMKRADQRSTITILVLGDEKVGKSSLISAFVSRHFSEGVPGIMTRLGLPPDPVTGCTTSLVDSQDGDAALMIVANSISLSATSTSGSTGAIASSGSSTSLTGGIIAGGTSISAQGDSGRSVPAADFGSSGSLAARMERTNSPGSRTTSEIRGIQHVDSIVLVYDLNRVETFFRLENHWLPLIERCYQGKVPVIVVENKKDLFRPSSTAGMPDTQALAPTRQQIVSLMQRFPFVRQCIKCSAKHLVRVDDVFLKAQQAVLYPLTPALYDLETGRFTPECNRAFTRIFRMFDRDHDGLLSDTELERFQRETYNGPYDRDVAEWKKMVTSYESATIGPGGGSEGQTDTADPVLQNGKFTVSGFLAIFDVFICKNRLDVVWQALRNFGYDDDLNLQIPDEILHPPKEQVEFASTISTTSGVLTGSTANRALPRSSLVETFANGRWNLGHNAKRFLVDLFLQYDSNKDGKLSPNDIIQIFSILPPPALPPWHPMRAPELFRGCFSVPKQQLSASSSSSSSSGSSEPVEEIPRVSNAAAASGAAAIDESLILQSNAPVSSPGSGEPGMTHPFLSSSGLSVLSITDSIPSVDVGGMFPLTKPLSLLEWMGHWHALAAISPSVTRTELYKLGHVEEGSGKRGRKDNAERRRGRKKKTSVAPIDVINESTLHSREMRVLVLGSAGCGKTALLNALCCGGLSELSMEVKPTETHPTLRPETSATFLKMKRKSPINSINASGGNGRLDDEGEEFVVHVVFTDVPEKVTVAGHDDHIKELLELFGSESPSKDRVCDLAMLVFDSSSLSSWNYVKDLEATMLTKDTPRVFVGTKSDLRKRSTVQSELQGDLVVDAATDHCRESELEPPLLLSAADSTLSSQSNEERVRVLDYLARCTLREPGVEGLRSKPHEEQKRRETARRLKMMWIGGIVAVGVAVAVGVGLFLGSGTSSSKGKEQKSSFSWLCSFFSRC